MMRITNPQHNMQCKVTQGKQKRAIVKAENKYVHIKSTEAQTNNMQQHSHKQEEREGGNEGEDRHFRGS